MEFLSLKGGCRGSSESTHVKMPHCWKSHALAHIIKVGTAEELKRAVPHELVLLVSAHQGAVVTEAAGAVMSHLT